MRIKRFMKYSSLLIAAATLSLLQACSGTSAPAAQTEGEEARGPHNGRLLVDGDFTLELAIFETGVPPEYRAWATQTGNPVDPASVMLTVQLNRFGNVVNSIEFATQADFLRSTSEVTEPHSFSVNVAALHAGKKHQWNFDSFEGRTTISAASAKEAGVQLATAGARRISDVLALYGTVVATPESVRSVAARYPGPIKSVQKSLGNAVKRGDILATVESNESLQTYAVTAPIGGVITSRNANPGEVAGSEPLFVITDLSNVSVDLSLFARDLARVKMGQRARIRAVDADSAADGQVTYISPAGSGANQALVVRVKLANADRRWTPGMHVNGDLLVGGKDVAVAVPAAALQRFRDWQVVFQADGNDYQAQPVEVGRTDGEWLELVSGLPAGATYVAANSFLIKADIEKSGASHDH